MTRRLATVLYLLTAISTLHAGLSSFRMVAAFFRTYARWADWLAVFYFAAPAMFFLAGTSAFWKDEKLKTSKWFTAGVVLSGLTVFFLYHGFGWHLWAGAAGALVSAIFIVSSLVKQSWKIAVIGTVIYVASQGRDLISRLQMYWAFGGSIHHLLVIVGTPTLVLASLVVAVTLHVKSRTRDTEMHLDGASSRMS